MFAAGGDDADLLRITKWFWEQKKPCAAKAEDTCESTSALAYSNGAPGQRVAGTVQFSVCEPEKCLIEKVKVASAIP